MRRKDLWADLRRRTQAEKEPITPFINSLPYIAMHFRHPPGDAQMARTAYRNLHSSYRRAFGVRTPMCLEDIQDWEIQHEKFRDLDHQWEAPPSAEKMNVAHAAFCKPYVRRRPRTGRMRRERTRSTRRPWSLLGNGRQWPKRRKTAGKKGRAVMEQPDSRLRNQEIMVRY